MSSETANHRKRNGELRGWLALSLAALGMVIAGVAAFYTLRGDQSAMAADVRHLQGQYQKLDGVPADLAGVRATLDAQQTTLERMHTTLEGIAKSK